MERLKHIGLQVDKEMLKKFYYVSKYYGRSGNGQVIYLIRSFVEEYEKEHGTITKEDLKNQD